MVRFLNIAFLSSFFSKSLNLRFPPDVKITPTPRFNRSAIFFFSPLSCSFALMLSSCSFFFSFLRISLRRFFSASVVAFLIPSSRFLLSFLILSALPRLIVFSKRLRVLKKSRPILFSSVLLSSPFGFLNAIYIDVDFPSIPTDALLFVICLYVYICIKSLNTFFAIRR